MSYTLLSEQTRTAARAHRCIWCWAGIGAGTRYVSERSVYDGSFQHHHWHPECRAAMLEEAAEEGGPIEWVPGRERPAAQAQDTPDPIPLRYT